jgi:pimeloyl-ACP methyl ester carboxylesterase
VAKGIRINPVTLILLPGLNGTDILFQPLMAALPAHIRAVAVNYPTNSRLSYEQLLPIVMAAVPKDEPFVLFGESFSGPLALMVAATGPVNLRGVVLCATFVSRPRPAIAWAVPFLARAWLFRFFPAAQKTKALIGGYSNPQLQELFAQSHAQIEPGEIAFRVRRVFQVDVRQQLADCRVPMLYLGASKDNVVPARNRRLIQQLRPDISVVTIDGPHGLPQTRPSEIAKAVEEFVDSIV